MKHPQIKILKALPLVCCLPACLPAYSHRDGKNARARWQVLIGYQGNPIANHPQGKCFKLNWATQGLSGSRQAALQAPAPQPGMDYPIFVGDLAHEVVVNLFRPLCSALRSGALSARRPQTSVRIRPHASVDSPCRLLPISGPHLWSMSGAPCTN